MTKPQTPDDFSINVKRLRSARRLRLRVLENGEVVVTCPIRLPKGYIDSFIAENLEWIVEKRSSAHLRLAQLTDERSKLFFRGKEYEFRLNISTTKKEKVEIVGDQLVVTAQSEDHEQVRTVLEKWYRLQAKEHFEDRVPLLADLVNRDVRRVTIRGQRSRWGSCSSRLTISLNWRLIMAPDSVSDYVVYHELAHLTHMDHSKRFWQLVEDYCPAYKKAEEWLKAHHSLLQF